MLKVTKKTLFMLIIVISVIVAIAVGCTNEEAGDSKQEKKDSSSKTSDSKDTTNLDPFSEEAGNQIIEADLALVETPEYFKNSPQFEYTIQPGTTPLKEGSYGQKYFEKKFNVKLNFITIDGENRKEQLNLMYATGTNPDLVTVKLADVAEYTKQGLLAEIPADFVNENMPNYYAILQEYDPLLLSITQVEGKNMGLARFYPNGGVPRPAAIRADWLKNVGITKTPETIEELEEAFLKFRNDDPDQNGAKDTYALSNPSDYDGQYWFQSIFGAYGTNPFIWVERDGKLQFGLTTPETKEALKLLNSWYEQGIIDPEFITDKGRSSDVKDLATKFTQGNLGYIDTLTFDDHQWDNDGHLSFRWVANHPVWQEWYEKHADDPETLYSQKVFTDFDDNAAGPIYISLPPVKGPNGASGYHRQGYQETVLVFGKHLEEDQEKFEKLLRILEFLHTDEEAHLKQSFGPEGLMWITDDSGQRLLNPDWPNHELFHPQFKLLGVNWLTNVMNWTNPDYLTFWGARDEQRYELTADVLRDYAYYENKVKIGLPSQAKYSEIVDTRVKEYVIKTIAGDIDIDKTFDDTVASWYKDGGEQLTKEANEWYNGLK